MMLLRFIFSACFLFAASSIHAEVVKADVVTECSDYPTPAKCEQAARTNALSLVSMQLITDVKTSSLLIESTTGPNLFNWQAKTSSQLPILGAQLNCMNSRAGKSLTIQCQASLDPVDASALYKGAMDDLISRATATQRKISEPISSQDLPYVREMTKIAQDFEKLHTVYRLLSPNKTSLSLPFSAIEYTEVLEKLEQSPESFGQLAQYAATLITGDNILLKPILPLDSNEVTPFASMFFYEMDAALQNRTTKQAEQADTTVAGTYQLQQQHMTLMLTETDALGRTMMARVWNVPQRLYAKFDTEPKLIDFERLLNQGVVQDDKFNVAIQTNQGNQGLMFVEGDSVKLLIKMNRSGYFFVMGHTHYEGSQFSYLMELNEEVAPYTFERYVGPDDVNRWLVLGEFEVTPDFGNESMQVFASDQSFHQTGRLPAYRFNGNYYQVEGATSTKVSQTRGLIRKKKARKSGPLAAEAVLMFRTVAKPK